MGVFLRRKTIRSHGLRLPHMRGGVSILVMVKIFQISSSPHAWGCFPIGVLTCFFASVFPTCVGVFLQTRFGGFFSPSLPPMRGGVSSLIWLVALVLKSSPHAWGCFSGDL